jgi:hypothetical protein
VLRSRTVLNCRGGWWRGSPNETICRSRRIATTAISSTWSPNRCRGSAITNMSQVGTPAAPWEVSQGSEDPALDGLHDPDMR